MSAPDVFISYARDDVATARRFAEALGAAGLNVWWDDDLRSGEVFDETIEAALRAAKAVVVLWSPKSVLSRWVRAEATLADRQKTLVPALIEACERPIIFEMIQTADLRDWDGNSLDPSWQSFQQHVCEIVGKTDKVEPLQPDKSAGDSLLRHASVAILPFTNMSRDEEQEYFADGITEDVITDLSKVSALRVIARNTAFTFKGKSVDVADVVRRLNVSHVVEGSVRRAGNRVRVTAQLIDGSNNSHLWAERWDRDLDDIFELQDELSQAIVDALSCRLLPKEKEAITERSTANVEAYDLYLRARHLDAQMGEEAQSRAVDLLRRAIRLDPKYMAAYGYLAEVLGNTTIITPHKTSAALAETAELERQASALDAGHPWVRVIRSALLVRKGDWIGLFRECAGMPETFTERPASYVPWVTRALAGQFERSMENARDLVRLNPLDFIATLTLLNFYDNTGSVAEADAESERSMDIPGNHGWINFLRFLRHRPDGSNEGQTQRYQRFLATRGPEMRIEPFDRIAPVLDDHVAASSIVSEAIDDPAYANATQQVWLACLAAYFGSTADSLRALRKAFVDYRPHLSVYMYLWNAVLADVHRDPRFKDLVRDIGLVDYWRESGNWPDIARPVGKDDFEILA